MMSSDDEGSHHDDGGLLWMAMSRLVLVYFRAVTLDCVAKNIVDYRNFAIDAYFPDPE